MSQNSIEPWKLTAFLLNELDPDERQLVEAAIACDAELKHELDSLRSTIDRTRSVLATPIGGAELAPANRALIASEIQATETLTSKTSLTRADQTAAMQWKWKALAALAASFLIGILAWPAFYGPTHLAQVNEATSKLSPAANPTTASTTTPTNKDEEGLSLASAPSGLRRELSQGSAASPTKSEFAPSERSLEEHLVRNSDVKESKFESMLAKDAPLSELAKEMPLPKLAQRLNPTGGKDILVERANSSPMPVAGEPTNPASTASPLDPMQRQDLSQSLDVQVAEPEGPTRKFMLGGSVNPEPAAGKSNLTLGNATIDSVVSPDMFFDELRPASVPTSGLAAAPGVELQAESTAKSTTDLYFRKMKDSDGDGESGSVWIDPGLSLVPQASTASGTLAAIGQGQQRRGQDGQQGHHQGMDSGNVAPRAHAHVAAGRNRWLLRAG